MEITKISLTKKAYEENDYRQYFKIIIDGKKEISVCDGGEPEDNSLGRDLNFVYSIVPLLEKAFKAGKNGEKLIIKEEEVSVDEF